MSPLFSALVFVALVYRAADAVVVSIDMKSTDSLRTRLIRSGKWVSVVDKVRQNLAVGAQPTDIDYFDSFYHINISLGVPPQYFIVSLDTGSANFWIVDASCRLTGCDSSTELYTRNKYNRNASRTAREDRRTFNTKHGSGWTRGRYVTDFITIGGLTFQNQTFGVAESARCYTSTNFSANHSCDLQVPEIFAHHSIDGVMGLAWPGIAAHSDVLTPINNLLNQLDEPILTMWTDRGRTGRTGSSGVVTLGGKDVVNCEHEWNYVSLTSRGLWQFAVEEFRIGNYRTWRRRSAISDTGTALIGGPHGLVTVIASIVDAQYSLTYDLHTVPCARRSNLSDLIFRIGNVNYHLPPEAYIRDLGMPDGHCVLGVFGMYAEGFNADWMFGDGFLNHFCTLYDYGQGRIGLAKAKS